MSAHVRLGLPMLLSLNRHLSASACHIFTSLAGVVLGGAVRGGTKALQRLTAQERLQDLHAASLHLEATASGLLRALCC